VRIIDAQAGDVCTASERTVTWSKGYRYRGEWSSSTAYAALDVVTSQGSSYLAKTSSTGKRPATNLANWGLLAARGAKGETGLRGAEGLRGPEGPQGVPGISTATFAGTGPGSYPNGDWQLIVLKPLPAGSWAVTATINSVWGIEHTGMGYCELRNGAGGFIGGTSAWVDGSQTFTMNGGLQVGAGGSTVGLYCRGPGSLSHQGAQLMALKVGGFS
jgi:hypothetical protein